MVICLKRDADLHMAQLMPLPLTVSCFGKIQIGFTFLVPAHLGSVGKRAAKRGVCVCCCGVGALFDNGDNELRSAFSYEMISQNKRAARFRLSSETHRVDNDDSYAVGAASTPPLLSQVASNGVGRVGKVRGGT